MLPFIVRTHHSVIKVCPFLERLALFLFVHDGPTKMELSGLIRQPMSNLLFPSNLQYITAKLNMIPVYFNYYVDNRINAFNVLRWKQYLFM